MPTNKNAVIRYRYIDELLSNRHKRYSTAEITEIVNEKLIKDGYAEVSLRCIQKDIKALEEEVFFAEITRENIAGKECVYYTDQSYSIFTKKLSTDEEKLLSEVLNTIGQFDGLDNFEWLDALKQRLNISEGRRIISFANNPDLHNSNLLGKLFTTISNKVVINLSYHTFRDPENVKQVVLHPYLLKQYNNRWYLLGAAEDGYILNFALDRIDDVDPMPSVKYMESDEGLEERFYDIVGVTLPKDTDVEKILLWVSDEQYPYIETKPIHGSQRLLKSNNEDDARSKYGYANGKFVELRCIPNRELLMTLASYLNGVVVLSPTSIREQMATHIKQLYNSYFEARK